MRRELYYGALTLYFVMGLRIGLLLGAADEAA